MVGDGWVGLSDELICQQEYSVFFSSFSFLILGFLGEAWIYRGFLGFDYSTRRSCKITGHQSFLYTLSRISFSIFATFPDLLLSYPPLPLSYHRHSGILLAPVSSKMVNFSPHCIRTWLAACQALKCDLTLRINLFLPWTEPLKLMREGTHPRGDAGKHTTLNTNSTQRSSRDYPVECLDLGRKPKNTGKVAMYLVCVAFPIMFTNKLSRKMLMLT